MTGGAGAPAIDVGNDDASAVPVREGHAVISTNMTEVGVPSTSDEVREIYKIEPNKVPDAFWVATSSDGRCDDVAGRHGRWIGQSLFPLEEGGAYCGYTWRSEPVASPDTDALLGAPNLHDSEPDEPAISVQQSDDEVSGWLEPLYNLTRARLGLSIEEGAPEQAADVRVAVIDTAAGDFYGHYRDPVGHGRAVGRMIDEIACGGQTNCRVQIANYPALSLATTDAMTLGITASGAGAYGTRVMLAAQIERASREWAQERAKGEGPRHLIINLSLGWSGCWEPRHRLGLESLVVRAALRRAACRGALVVAAGGNRDAVPGCPKESSQPWNENGEHVLPALWAGSDRPTERTCQRMGIEAHASDIGPLVFGVSAVDQWDQQLAVADQESNLVAYGNAVVVPDGLGWTHQLSGTSMSAAAVSGIAAAVWSAFPDRTLRQLEGDLIEPAVALRPRSLEQHRFICNDLPGVAPIHRCASVRRASLCRSLAHAAGLSSTCGPDAYEATPVSFPILSAQSGED